MFPVELFLVPCQHRTETGGSSGISSPAWHTMEPRKLVREEQNKMLNLPITFAHYYEDTLFYPTPAQHAQSFRRSVAAKLKQPFPMAMAFMIPGRCVGLGVSRPAHVKRRLTAFATLSPPRSDAVDWVKATSGFFEQDTRPIMLFDGVCNLCNGGVKFVRDNDRNGRIRFEALQSEAGKKLLQRSGREPDDISSVVLVEIERSYIKSEAVLKIMEYIDLPFPQLAFFLQFVPLFIRDFAYDNVANNRYTIFGRSDSCEI